MNRKNRANMAGDSRDDDANADADMPSQAKERPPGEGVVQIPDAAEKEPQGEGPVLEEDEGDGLGPPNGHGDDNDNPDRK